MRETLHFYSDELTTLDSGGRMDLPLSPNAGMGASAEAVNRSNTCAVCGAVSKHFYLNYGAPVCFSCRAFFRRVEIK